jgi:DNA-binding NtrC family response regulator
MHGEARPTVVVVDDEDSVADAYVAMLQADYDVRAAYGGHEAMEMIDDSVDVVLLDRRMPEVSGDEVLKTLVDRGCDVRVVMTTAVEPTTDILEMPFDDYLCKPVDKSDLEDVIDQQLVASRYDERLSEYMNVTSKLALLEAEKPPSELESNDEVTELRERASEIRNELDAALEEFDDIDHAFREIGRSPG